MARDPGFDRVVLDARIAFREGDQFFYAGQTVKPGMRASAGQASRSIDRLIAAVEAEGWKAVEHESVGAEAEVTFVRDEGRRTAAPPATCVLVMMALITMAALVAAAWPHVT